MKKRYLVKVIPPAGYSVYRFEFTRHHVSALVAGLFVVMLAVTGLHFYQIYQAQAKLVELQSLTTAQHAKLSTIDAEADALSAQLRNLQHQNQEIRRIIGLDRGRPASRRQPLSERVDAFHESERVAAPEFSSLQRRIERLASASIEARNDEAHLKNLTMRVLNLRHMQAIARERMLAAIPSLNPAGTAGIASGYGYRSDPWPEFHKGVDLDAQYGDLVRAAAAGKVVSADWDGGYGIKVDIDHGNGYHTWYAHLSRATVRAGEFVAKGQPIALVGSTGASTGPHLHYQVMLDGNPIDPTPYLSGVPRNVLVSLK